MDGGRTIGASVREGVSPAEWETRVKLAACYRLVDRYGNWVTYEPPLGPDTILLYLAPLLALLGGGWLAFSRMRGSSDEEDSAA